MNRGTLKTLFSYLTIYVVWGSTYFFIKMAVQSFPPPYVLAFRFTTGGVLLLGAALISGALKHRPTAAQILSSVLLGTLFLIGANGLVTVAERRVDSYIVALVMAAVPLTVAFFDRVLFGKRVTWMRAAGVLVGFGGVALLLYNGESLRGSLTPHTLMVLAAMLLWSFGTSLGHRLPLPPDSRINSGIQMLFAGLVCTGLALGTGPPPVQSLSGVTLPAALGLAYLAVIGSLAIAAYAYLIVHEPASRIVSYALVNPGIAVLLGLILGQETAAPYMALGSPLILLGLVTTLYGENLRRALGRLGRRSGPEKPR